MINDLGETLDYEYDRLGNLSKVKQYQDAATFTTTKTYDERGALLSNQQPAGSPTTYENNAAGLPITISDRSGKVTNMFYDDNLRLSEAKVIHNGMSYYYHPLGLVEKTEVWNDSSGSKVYSDSLGYEYYSTGLVKKRSLGTNNVSFEYDVLGNREKITDPFDLQVSYAYDSLNRLDTVTVDGKIFYYDFYADGMLKTIDYPNGARVEYTYDNINQLKTVVNKFNTNIISQYSYNYDNNGNIVSVTDNGELTTYQYDSLNRLKGIQRANGEHVYYQYDSRGNRKQIGGKDQTVVNFIPGDFGYNSWDELSQFTTGSTNYQYQYDAEGLRTKKISPNTTTNYYCDDNGLVIAEADVNNQVTAEIVLGHKPLARKVNGQYYYYIYNGHGDVVQVLDATGVVTHRYSYDEWGNILSKTEQMFNPIRYAGEYYDEESGLYYLRARYYDPSIGRFISRDSYEGEINNPLSLNPFTYCYNNPLGFIDPTGNIVYKEGDITYENIDGRIFKDGELVQVKDYKYIPSAIGGTRDSQGTGNNEIAEKFEQEYAKFEGASLVFLTVAGIIFIDGMSDQMSLGDMGVGNAVQSSNKIKNLAKDIIDWLGEGAKMIKNKSGDTVLLSKNGTKRVRFDINNPSPHNNPHGHVEELINGKWVKSGPIYPNDVPHN